MFPRSHAGYHHGVAETAFWTASAIGSTRASLGSALSEFWLEGVPRVLQPILPFPPPHPLALTLALGSSRSCPDPRVVPHCGEPEVCWLSWGWSRAHGLWPPRIALSPLPGQSGLPPPGGGAARCVGQPPGEEQPARTPATGWPALAVSRAAAHRRRTAGAIGRDQQVCRPARVGITQSCGAVYGTASTLDGDVAGERLDHLVTAEDADGVLRFVMDSIPLGV
jgi:hypothetical protein